MFCRPKLGTKTTINLSFLNHYSLILIMSEIMLERIPEIHDPRLDCLFRTQVQKHAYSEGAGLPLDSSAQGLILDVACGQGAKAYTLSTQFRRSRIVGIDIDPEAIAFAKRTYAEPHLEFQVQDAYQMSKTFSDADVILIAYSMHHFDGLDDLFKEVSAALKPGGVFVATDFDRSKAHELVESHNLQPLYQRLLDLRTTKSDKECMDYFVKKGLLHLKRPEVLLLMSLMASYSSSEVANALRRNGFDGEVNPLKNALYSVEVNKPEQRHIPLYARLIMRLLKNNQHVNNINHKTRLNKTS